MATQETNSINPGLAKGLLAALPLSYSVFQTRPFKLEQHVREIACTYKQKEGSPPTEVERRVQLKHWEACVDSALNREDSGWTLGISGPGSIAYPEAVAAQLAAYYLRRGRNVVWINLTANLGGERDFGRLTAPWMVHQIDAFILTGLRWTGDAVRFDKAFDLLRQTHEDTDRIIVGVGEDPLAITRSLDISINRALCVTEAPLVEM